MFVINNISIGLLLVAITTLLVGMFYSTVRDKHDLYLHGLHNLTILEQYNYRAIIDEREWRERVERECKTNLTKDGRGLYTFHCTNTTFIDEIYMMQESYKVRVHDGTIIEIIYVSFFSIFAILSIIVGKLYGLWLHLRTRPVYEQL